MSDKKKMVIRVSAIVIIAIILTIILQGVGQKIVVHTTVALTLTSIVYLVMFVFIIADITTMMEHFKEVYFYGYHKAAAKFEAAILLVFFVISIICNKVVINQYANLGVWVILLIISIIMVCIYYKNLLKYS